MAITARAGGQSESYLSWAVFATLIIAGGLTALQASRVWRLGAGHVLIMGGYTQLRGDLRPRVGRGRATPASEPCCRCLALLPRAGHLAPVAASDHHAGCFGHGTDADRVHGHAIALDRVQEMPKGAPEVAGPTVAVVTLAVTTGLVLRASGAWRLWSLLIGIGVGCVAAALFGAYDVQRVVDAPWIGVAEVGLPGFDLTPDASFWALLPVFVVVMLVGGIKNVGDSVAIQQASRRRPRVTDFRLVQGSLNTNGLGILLSGVAGRRLRLSTPRQAWRSPT